MLFYCPQCGERVIWQNDWDAEDIDSEVEGIISYYVCPDCCLTIEAYYDDTCAVLRLLNDLD